MIPLGTDRPLRRRPVVTPALISINVGIFAAMLVIQAMDPESAVRVQAAGWVGGGRHEWYRFITSAFLHAGFMHILGNMLFLWVFGPPVEDRFGRLGFAAFYLFGAVASGLVHVASDASPAVGASGAIAGVTGAFMVLFPLTRVRTLMILGIIGLIMVPSWFFIGLKIAFDIFAEGFGNDNVANMAHLGGYGYGIAVALTLLWTGVLKREPYDLFSLARHRNRRRQFRAAAEGQRSKPHAAARTPRPDPESDELAERRARVSALVAENRLDDAADAYESLTDAFAHRPHAGTLSRDAQVRLIGHLLTEDRRRLAARALEGFVATYPHDPERSALIVLLGRLYARDLDNAKRARELLDPIARQDHDTETRAMAREELAALGEEEQARTEQA